MSEAVIGFFFFRPGDPKTVFILFSATYVFRIFSLRSPVVKFKKYFFLNIVVWRIKKRVLEHWIQISKKYWKMSENVRLTCEKPCFLENFQILQLFYYLCSQFSWLKNDLIFVFSFSMRFFWTVTRLYFKKIFF